MGKILFVHVRDRGHLPGCDPGTGCLLCNLWNCAICHGWEGSLTKCGCPGFPITCGEEDAIYKYALTAREVREMRKTGKVPIRAKARAQ